MKNIVKGLLLPLLLVAGLAMLPVVSGCDETIVTKTDSIDTTFSGLSLTELWELIADSTDIREPTAEMDYLRVTCDTEGSLQYLYFVFYGRNDEEIPCTYIADLGQESRINIRQYTTDSVIVSRHPTTIFSEIERVGVGTLEQGEGGLTVQISFLSGDVGYRRESMDIYHLKDGVLLPLEEIIFHNQTTWCETTIFKLGKNETVTRDDGTTVSQSTTAAAPMEPGNRSNQIWFFNDDIEMAETVTYITETDQSQGG